MSDAKAKEAIAKIDALLGKPDRTRTEYAGHLSESQSRVVSSKQPFQVVENLSGELELNIPGGTKGSTIETTNTAATEALIDRVLDDSK